MLQMKRWCGNGAEIGLTFRNFDRLVYRNISKGLIRCRSWPMDFNEINFVGLSNAYQLTK